MKQTMITFLRICLGMLLLCTIPAKAQNGNLRIVDGCKYSVGIMKTLPDGTRVCAVAHFAGLEDNYSRSDFIFPDSVVIDGYKVPTAWPSYPRRCNIFGKGWENIKSMWLSKKAIIPNEENPFTQMPNLESITVDGGGNQYVSTIDNMLCSTIGNTLIYVSPREEIVIPDFIRNISDSAFFNTRHAKSLVLPNSLGPDQIVYKLRFLEDLEHISIENNKWHATSEDRKSLFSPDIYNWTGRPTILSYVVPAYDKEEYIVPEFVTQIHYFTGAFYKCDNIRRLILPDSVCSFAIFSPDMLKNLEYLKVGKNFGKNLRLDNFFYFDILSQLFDVCFSHRDYNTYDQRGKVTSEWVENHPPIEIDIDEENPYICEEDDVIYTKDKKSIVFYPYWKKTDTFIIPEGVENDLCGNPFYTQDYQFEIEKVVIPSTFRHIEVNDGHYRLLTDTIYCYAQTPPDIYHGSPIVYARFYQTRKNWIKDDAAEGGFYKPPTVLYVPAGCKPVYENSPYHWDLLDIREMNETSITPPLKDNSQGEPLEFYSPLGIKTSKPTKGINIMRMGDGSVRKSLVR
ncbi:MAG: hypothetical protein IJR87_02645 [Bacteroidaceae bacterium]|nr:hypothetical protein [Bacteroidaceae bacterium]